MDSIQGWAERWSVVAFRHDGKVTGGRRGITSRREAEMVAGQYAIRSEIGSVSATRRLVQVTRGGSVR